MIKKFFKKIFIWFYIKIHSLFIRLAIALHRTEIDVLKSKSIDVGEGEKKIQRHRHTNPILEKFYAGQHDEKYVKEYYELLKKADKFMRNVTPNKMEAASFNHTGGHYGKKDKFGRSYEHFGFFDEKHKHAGKTIADVLDIEYNERRVNDDEHELIYIFNNTPIEVGLSEVFDSVKTHKKDDESEEQKILDINNKSKQFKFPMTVVRSNDKTINKIEELTEHLHVKKIAFEHRVLEFFIPLKFKTIKLNKNSKIFNELIDINEVYFRNEYGELLSFGLLEFKKRLQYKNSYEILKFQGIEMKKMN